MAFVPYQVDYQVTSKGKTLGVTKKKVVFKFGFANPEALAEGVVGSNCRGAEHQVDFIWSLNSGKRQLALDGKEVHYSESGANGWTGDREFQHVFNLRTPGFGPIRCHFVTQPSQQGPYRRPFDLRINGVSYFDCAKIFQLGTAAMTARPLPSAPAPGPHHDPEVDPYATPEERRLIAQAKLESLRDLKTGEGKPPPPAAAPKPMPRQEVSLIDFGGEEPTPAAVVGGAAPQYVSNLTLDTTLQRGTSSGGDSYNLPSPPRAAAPPYGQQPQPSSPYGQQQPQPTQYGQQQPPPPQQPQQQQPPPPQPQQPYPTQYAPGPSGAASSALTQWQPAPGAPQNSWGNALSPIPSVGGSWASGAPSQPSAGGRARPPAHSWGGGPPPGQQFQSPPPPTQAEIQNAFSPSYGQAPPPQQQPQQQTPAFASPQSYGSAPSFAQPPQQQQQQQVPSGSASAMTYGSAAPSFAQPPQQQQYPAAGGMYTGY